MSALVISKSIPGSPEVVFERITDFANLAEHVEGIEKIEMLTDGTVGVGTRFRETRIMFNREATEEMHVIEFEHPKYYTLQADSCGALYTTRVEVEAEPGGSRVVMSTTVKPQTLVAKLMSPLGFLMKGMMKKCLEQDLDAIARRFEETPVSE